MNHNQAELHAIRNDQLIDFFIDAYKIPSIEGAIQEFVLTSPNEVIMEAYLIAARQRSN